MKICTIDKCIKSHYGKGLCSTHYKKSRQIIINEQQRRLRNASNNNLTKVYEKTINGFLMRSYRNLKSRVTGVQKAKNHLYLGLPYLNKESFYVWAKSNLIFLKMYEVWVQSDYNQKLTPSVDRINPELGYIIENMRWLILSDNSKNTRRPNKA